MRKKTTKKSNPVKRRSQRNAVRSSARQREMDRRTLPEKIGSAQRSLASRVEAVADHAMAELRHASDVSVFSAKNAGEGLLGTAASITGVVLGVISMPVVAPVIVGLQLLNAGRPVRAAADVLLGGSDGMAGGSRQQNNNDLKMREYRDETGEIHHHTHTYMRDHPEELRRSAA